MLHLGPATNIRARAQKGKGTGPVPTKWAVVVCLLLGLATIALYSSVARFPFINYDDPDYVITNQHVRSGVNWGTMAWAFTATEEANWHPLTWLSHALDCQLYGLDAGGHHITSLVLHILNAILLFLLLSRVTGATGRSAVVAALFALHPFNVESVVWVSERKNVLSAFFFLLTLGAYGFYVRQPNWKRYTFTGVLFGLGLASKPMIITLPCVLFLLDYWPLGRIQAWSKPSKVFPIAQTSWAGLVLEKVPLLVLSAASAVITLVAQQLGHAVEPLGELPLRMRLTNAVYSYAVYVAKVFWPFNFALIYPHPLATLTLAQVALSVFSLMVITGYVWRERSKHPYLVTGWCWFLGMLVPVIGIVQVGAQGMADRYAYLPAIGIFVILVWGCFDLANHWQLNPWTIAAMAVAVLAAFSVLTFRQIGYWRSSQDLWMHTLEVTQNNFIADDGMGDLLLKEGQSQALGYYKEAARLAPWDPVSHGAVAASLQDEGKLADAIREYETVLRAKPKPKLQAYTYANLGVIYRQLGNYAAAKENSEQALRVDSEAIGELIQQLSDMVVTHPTAVGYFRLGLLLEGASQFTEARAAYERALQLNPRFSPARKALELVPSTSRQ